MNTTGGRIRPPAVAGTFYPRDRESLTAAIERSFAGAVHSPGPNPITPKAIVAPHAGYVYSGAVAASAFALLEPMRDSIKRVVVVGPSHRTWLDGIGVSSADAWETPLGRVAIDEQGRSDLLHLPFVNINDRAHAPEHSLEVELPFLQTALDEFTLLPLIVGDATDTQVAEAIDAAWKGPDTLVVVSTDLSHYLTHEEATGKDSMTADAIVRLRPALVRSDDACGFRGLRGLMRVVAGRGLEIRRLDPRNSGDTAGITAADMERVVGYGAFAVC